MVGDEDQFATPSALGLRAAAVRVAQRQLRAPARQAAITGRIDVVSGRVREAFAKLTGNRRFNRIGR
jgi:hypothetical protein